MDDERRAADDSALPEYLFAFWFASSPWASYWIRFPAEKSIVTFDRVFVAAIVASLLVRAWKARRIRGPGAFEIAWLAYGAVGLASAVALATNKPFALRIAVDAFLMPGVLFYALRTGFDPRRGARSLFFGAILLGLSLPWIGIYESLSRRDVMAYEGSGLFRANVVRANGPFASDNSYAIVSALVAIFVLWLPRLLRVKLDRAATIAWIAAQLAAGFAACTPLFRAVIGAMGAALAIPYATAGRVRTLARAALVAGIVVAATIPFWLRASQSVVFRDRVTDPSSAFSRLATYRAAIDVIGEHPLAGVGLAQYRTYFDERFGTAWYIDVEEVSGVGAEDSPHNNVLGTWAELGLAGIFFYLLASFLLAWEAWRRRCLAALALMAVYWIPGMTLQSGVYSDLNLYYFAMIAVAFRADSTREKNIAAGP